VLYRLVKALPWSGAKAGQGIFRRRGSAGAFFVLWRPRGADTANRISDRRTSLAVHSTRTVTPSSDFERRSCGERECRNRGERRFPPHPPLFPDSWGPDIDNTRHEDHVAHSADDRAVTWRLPISAEIHQLIETNQ